MTSTPHCSRNRSALALLCAGPGLLLGGAAIHPWALEYMLEPEIPFRLNARLHWWVVSINAMAAGVWLTFWRNKVRPLAVAALGLLYAVLGFLLVAMDLWRAYRAVRVSDSRMVKGEYQIMDKELGWALKPGGKARVVRPGLYDVSYEIGADGFRKTTPHSEELRSIFVLGDSFAFGWGVNDEETFCSRLAGMLVDEARIINMGVEGHGITQIYARFLQNKARVKRDDIVIFTFIADDITRSWSDFMFVSRMLFGPKPLQSFPVFERGNIRLQATDSLFYRGKALLVHAPWLGSLAGNLCLPRSAEAMESAREMIEKLRTEVEAREAKFMLVQLPTGGELRKHHAPMDCSGLGALQIEDQFPAQPEALRRYFLSADDGHYAAEGHRLVADTLNEELVKRGWLR